MITGAYMLWRCLARPVSPNEYVMEQAVIRVRILGWLPGTFGRDLCHKTRKFVAAAAKAKGLAVDW